MSAIPAGVGRVRAQTVTLAHGSGGRAMRNLIADVFLRAFDNPTLARLEDQALVGLAKLAALGDRLAFTTDSYVVTPLFFSGGDIGRLAVNGTVNDLAMSGARPCFLSCSVVIEEGFAIDSLRRVAASMRDAARAADVEIVTGDTKVVERGACDGLFVNTAGIGVVRSGVNPGSDRARSGDQVLVNGPLGDHGAAITVARNDLALQSDIASDCKPLNGLVAAMLAACPDIHCLRDATRGGVATVLNEIAESSRAGIRIREAAVPVREAVRGVCEILGFDPLYLPNEGTLVAVVPPESAAAVLEAMRGHPAGRGAALIGEIIDEPRGTVILGTRFGGERIVDMLVGAQLPRIC